MSNTNPNEIFNEDHVLETWYYLKHICETEIRAMPGGRPVSQFIHSPEEFLRVCRELNGKGNVYVGINERREGGTHDEEVEAVRTIILDVDPVRAEGFKKDSATVEEMKYAEEAADKISETVLMRGIHRPIKCLSGNGYQLWFAIPEIKVDAKNWEDVNEKMQSFQRNIKKEFETPRVSIDNIGNLSRIIKVMGTLSVKGKGTPERPHRMARPLEPMTRDEDKHLRAHILALKIKAPVAKVTLPIVGKVNNETLRLSLKHCDTWMKGENNDRSKADFKVAMFLMKMGATDDQVSYFLSVFPYGKTGDRGEKYLKFTVENARESVGRP